MTPHSSTLAWKIPWMEEPGRLQSIGSLRVGRLSDFTFHFHALEKEMATHSSVLAWRIPGMGEPGGLSSLGSHRVRHDWSDLAAVGSINTYVQLIFIYTHGSSLQAHQSNYLLDISNLTSTGTTNWLLKTSSWSLAVRPPFLCHINYPSKWYCHFSRQVIAFLPFPFILQ